MTVFPVKRVLMARAAAALLALAQGMSAARAAGDIEIADAWIRFAPPAMKMHAGYFTMTNAGSAERELVAVESPAYGGVALHISREQDGVATMEHVAQVAVPPGGTVEFAPGGLHLMLMEPKAAQAEGAHVPLTLVFQDGERVEIRATVKKGMQADGHSGHDGHEHHHHHKGM